MYVLVQITTPKLKGAPVTTNIMFSASLPLEPYFSIYKNANFEPSSLEDPEFMING